MDSKIKNILNKIDDYRKELEDSKQDIDKDSLLKELHTLLVMTQLATVDRVKKIIIEEMGGKLDDICSTNI